MSNANSKGILESTAIGISALLSLTYVIVIHVNKPKNTTLQNGIIDRNDDVVVRDRIFKVTMLSLLTVAILPLILSKMSGIPVPRLYFEYGILPGFKYTGNSLAFDINDLAISIRDIFKNLWLVILLFNGPLIDYLFFNTEDSSMLKDLYDHLSTIQGLRDLIIGPITEEIIYTASIILILNQVQGVSANTLIYLPPVFFSFAHFHHAYELYTHGSIPLKVILISSTFQLAYTFLFGIFTNYLFLRTRNVWSCFVVHFFCNFMGFPKIGGFANKLWRVVYFGLLIVGIWLFKSNLQQLTESPLRLVVDL